MKEILRTCFHFMMLPIWRRKYLVVTGCLVWALFYIYLHHVSGSNQAVVNSAESSIEVTLTTGSLYAKLPIDMALLNSQERIHRNTAKKRATISNQQDGDGQKIPAINAARDSGLNSYPKQAAKQLSGEDKNLKKAYENIIEDPILSLDNEGNDQLLIGETVKLMEKEEAKDRGVEGERVNEELNRVKVMKKKIPSLAELTENRSVKNKLLISGIQPTSFIVRPKDDQVVIPTPKKENVTSQKPSEAPSRYIPPLRLVHFDLKGAPPKVSYFKAIFPLVRDAGANGILMEYEDTFPFWGPLEIIAARNAYKRKDIQMIVEMAKGHNLEIVPLVQTFGHLEFVLKLKEFKHLREVSELPQALCPTNNGSLEMVKSLIDQVMALHEDSKWLHIGSDEVFQLGHCKRCSRYDRNSLFLTHVRKVAKYVREKHKVVPIMWDDMLRHTTVTELEKYEMGKLVEPMAWTYVEDVYLFIPDSLWEKYSKVFPSVWAASAFKGAFGETLTVPNAKRHLENNRAWLGVMNEQHGNFKSFRGIAITGWQRYDHFAALCELLPSGLPSLILNLLTVSQGHFDANVFPRMQEILDCSSRSHYHLDLDHDPYLWRALGVCFFPGSPVFRLSLRHSDAVKALSKYLYDVTVRKGWLTVYNINHNFTSPMRVNELLREFSYHNSSLFMLYDAAVKALREVFDDHTVNEWIELNVYPYIVEMKKLWDDGMRLKNIEEWPRRPFPRAAGLRPLPFVSRSLIGDVNS